MPNLANLPTADLQAGAHNWSGPGYIDGLQMQWVSATAVTVSSGRAYIPSLSYYLDAPNAIALTGLVLTALTWYHLYLYSNAGAPTIECVTTAPAAPYSGTARAKTGDTSRRYIGSIKTDAAGAIIQFYHIGNAIKYIANFNSGPYYLLADGQSITPATISCATVVPVTSLVATLLMLNADTTNTVTIGNPATSFVLSASAYLAFIYQNSSAQIDFPLDASQQMNYVYTSTPAGGLYVRAVGYVYER